MTKAGQDRFIDAAGLRTHFLDIGEGPPLVLLHGLSANAHSFAGLVDAGLARDYRVIAPDLRGRGQSDHPADGYRMADHAGDVIALLDALGLDQVVLGGHSFGAYLAAFVAAGHPGRVSKLIVLDAALTVNPRAGEMLKPSLDRLTRVSPSADAYLAEVRGAPYMDGHWDGAIEEYFRAEIVVADDGTARSATSASAIAAALMAIGQEEWPAIVARAAQPALLLNAVGAYGPPGAPPLIEGENAIAMAAAFPDCRYARVPGNHLTMMFGAGAAAIVAEIRRFLGDGGGAQAPGFIF